MPAPSTPKLLEVTKNTLPDVMAVPDSGPVTPRIITREYVQMMQEHLSDFRDVIQKQLRASVDEAEIGVLRGVLKRIRKLAEEIEPIS